MRGRLGPAGLRRRREALHLTQADLGRVLGVARNTLARWERGKVPIRHPELVALALDHLDRLALLAASERRAASGPRHDPPAELTSLIGREQELTDLLSVRRTPRQPPP